MNARKSIDNSNRQAVELDVSEIKPPILWQDRFRKDLPIISPTRANVSPIAFINFHYSRYLKDDGTGLNRHQLSLIDPKLGKALSSWLYTHAGPFDLLLPTLHEARRLQEKSRETLPQGEDSADRWVRHVDNQHLHNAQAKGKA